LGENRTWKEEGLRFLKTATTEQQDVIAGMQYYYDSKHAAQCRNGDNDDEGMEELLDSGMSIDDEDNIDENTKVNGVTMEIYILDRD
jgi:hypothetical protein